MRHGFLWVFLLLCVLNATAQEEQVLFSAPGGVYEDSFTLKLGCLSPQHHIRYTTNGSQLSATSTRYQGPLPLDESLFSHSDYYTIPICPSDLFYKPDSVRHAILIRAAVFDEEGHRISHVGTHTYLIHALGCDTHGLPVISIAADSLDLFGYETGILVPGIHFDPENALWTGNYYQEGEEWERRIHMEFYEPDGTLGINQDAGLRTHGGTGRRGHQKCMKLYARKEYGAKRFEYKVFEEIPNESFKHLVLKPFSCQWFVHGIQDDICNRIAATVQVESLASRPAVMYLNGEYWGIYFLKEKPDAHFLEDHFGYDEEDYNVIENWGGGQEDGDNTNFREMMSWLRTCDLTDSMAYQRVCSMIDVDCFIDYYCLEMFIANQSWPGNNMRCYQLNDGPWRWIFFDGDDCLMKMNLDIFDNATSVSGTGWPNSLRRLFCKGGIFHPKSHRKIRPYSILFLFLHENPIVMKTYKWLRGILKASALTTVMFVMQACYGAPHPTNGPTFDDEEYEQPTDSVTDTAEAPLELDDAADLP